MALSGVHKSWAQNQPDNSIQQYPIFVDHQYGTCFMSPCWCLFEVAPRSLENLWTPGLWDATHDIQAL